MAMRRVQASKFSDTLVDRTLSIKIDKRENERTVTVCHGSMVPKPWNAIEYCAHTALEGSFTLFNVVQHTSLMPLTSQPCLHLDSPYP